MDITEYYLVPLMLAEEAIFSVVPMCVPVCPSACALQAEPLGQLRSRVKVAGQVFCPIIINLWEVQHPGIFQSSLNLCLYIHA